MVKLGRYVICYKTYRSGLEEDVTSLDNLCRDLYEWDGDVVLRYEDLREMKARKVGEEAQSANVITEAAMSSRGE
mgnify:CR=1 FL=1